MPRLSFGPPLPLGIESEAEFMDLELTQNLSEQAITLALNRSLPPGLEVIQVTKLTKKVSSLMASVDSIVYQFIIKVTVDKRNDQIEAWFKHLWDSKELMIVKRTKSGEKPVNIRPFWRDYTLSFIGDDIILFEMKVEFGPRGTLRPDNFISLLPQDFQVQRIIRKAMYSRTEECCEKVL
jgi:radical SAM-linked protein